MEKTIKVGYDSKTGFYTFKPTSLHSNMEVNGKSIVDPILGFKSGELVVVSEKPESITYKTTKTAVKEYKNIETNQIVSIQDYNQILSKVKSTEYFPDGHDDDDEPQYKTFEDEVFALRFYRNWKPVYETTEETVDLTIEIIEYPVSAYPCIIPLYTVDATNIFETKCKLVPNNEEMFFEVCASYGIDRSRIELSSAGIEYVKIDGKFLETGQSSLKGHMFFNSGFVGTYEECVTRMNMKYKSMEDVVGFYVASQSNKIVDQATVGNILLRLKTIQSSVNSLDVKIKDSSSKRYTLDKIRELIDICKQQA